MGIITSYLRQDNVDFDAASLVRTWAPDGKICGHEWQALNPTRPDKNPGSFSVNTRTGKWADFATGDKGGDPVSLAALLPDHAVVTSPFGAKSAGKADWSVLEGRDVTIWPDADAVGAAYARDVMRLVAHAKLVDLGGLPEGWDLADDAPDGVDIAKRLAEAKAPKGFKFSGNGQQKPGAKAILKMSKTRFLCGRKSRHVDHRGEIRLQRSVGACPPVIERLGVGSLPSVSFPFTA